MLDAFLKSNPVGTENPIYRHKAIQHKNQLLKQYNSDLFSREYEKLKQADLLTEQIVKMEGEHIVTLEDELKKHWMLTCLSSKSPIFDRTIPLTHSEVRSALKALPHHSSLMKLPKSLVINASDSYLSILEHGIPNKSHVEESAKKLKESLTAISQVLNYERFEDVSYEDLKSRVSLQNWTNYFMGFKRVLCSSPIVSNDIIPPTQENYAEFERLVELFKKMDVKDIDSLFQLENFESYIQSGDYLQIYKILKNNSSFLKFIKDTDEHVRTIEDYLLYQTLTEINYLQNAIKIE